jgi:hypothetical protein
MVDHPDSKEFQWVLENNQKNLPKYKDMLDNYMKVYKEYENFRNHQYHWWKEHKHILRD